MLKQLLNFKAKRWLNPFCGFWTLPCSCVKNGREIFFSAHISRTSLFLIAPRLSPCRHFVCHNLLASPSATDDMWIDLLLWWGSWWSAPGFSVHLWGSCNNGENVTSVWGPRWSKPASRTDPAEQSRLTVDVEKNLKDAHRSWWSHHQLTSKSHTISFKGWQDCWCLF